ncbi:MAG: hypothetical protein R3C16_04540 [Hyphomonadaceae bacterium]
MRDFARRSIKALAVAVALSPFVALAALFFWAGTMSMVMVAPDAYWMAAAIFVIPVVVGWVLWRLANFVC